jgi:hypothetical protein
MKRVLMDFEVATDLDRVFEEARAQQDLPQEAWAFDPTLGVCRRVQWANPKEPLGLRRTALAVALVEADALKLEQRKSQVSQPNRLARAA